MKYFYTLLFTVICCSASLQTANALSEALPTVTDFRIEGKDSQKREVPILVLFMSNTCHYCKVVLEDFLMPMQRDPEYKNKVVLRQIETGSGDKLIDFNGNTTTLHAFARKHNVWGVPVVMLFNSKGEVLTSIKGLLTLDYYFAYLDNAINESQAKIKDAK